MSLVSDLRVNLDGRVFDGRSSGNLFVARDGLDGWWDSAETRTPDDVLPQSNGSQTPNDILLAGRRVVFKGWMDSPSTTAAETEFRTWAAGLARKWAFLFGVWHEGRWRWMRNASVRGKVRVRPNRNDLRKTEIELTVWSPDPFKYGDEVIDRTTGVASGQTFTITNPGTAPLYPWFQMGGGITNFTLTGGGGHVEFDGTLSPSSNVLFSPYSGGRAAQLNGDDRTDGLIRADWPVVLPEESTTLTLTADSTDATAYVETHNWDGAWA